MTFFGRASRDPDSTNRAICPGPGVAWTTRTPDPDHRQGTPHPSCWRCHRSMGCSRCVGGGTELLCVPCAVWATPAAFAHHGPLRNDPHLLAKRQGKRAPQFPDYPPAFQQALTAALSAAEHPDRFPPVPSTSHPFTVLAATLVPPPDFHLDARDLT